MNCFFFFLQFLLLLNRIAVDGVAFIYSVFLRRSRQRLNNSPFEMSVMRTGSKAKLVHLPFTTRGNGIVEPQPNTCATHFAPKKTTDTQVTFIDFSVFAANLSNNAAVVDVHIFFRSLEFSIKKITIPFFLSFHCVLVMSRLTKGSEFTAQFHICRQCESSHNLFSVYVRHRWETTTEKFGNRKWFLFLSLADSFVCQETENTQFARSSINCCFHFDFSEVKFQKAMPLTQIAVDSIEVY